MEYGSGVCGLQSRALSGSTVSSQELVVQLTDAMAPKFVFADFRVCDDAKDLLFQSAQL
jgi:hypothetical protein